jgi:Flp pilus assembly protein TadG
MPLILLTMLATAEFGRALYQYTTLTKAVQTGTRFYASDQTIPQATINNLITTASPDGSGPAILLDTNGNSGITVTEVVVDGDHVRVSAEYDFAPLIAGIPIFGSAATITMTASHSMRAL